ncbi:MAG TPA: single-stranded DNA-binding protein [Streptomyces sp.]|nr:single-stranded DNA-binding protein [Streptomyces sp.]
MHETMVCVVGNVATQPVYREAAHRESASAASARFRLAATPRYWDRDRGVWADGHTSFYTVWANRQLAANVAASLSVGEPVVVQGRLRVRSETRDGQSRTWADIDAVAVGHDLARGTAAFRRSGRPDTPAAAPEPDPHPAPAAPVAPRPEPDWETAPPATAPPAAAPLAPVGSEQGQPRPEPALLT